MIIETSWHEFRERQIAEEVAKAEHVAPIGEMMEWLSSKIIVGKRIGGSVKEPLRLVATRKNKQ